MAEFDKLSGETSHVSIDREAAVPERRMLENHSPTGGGPSHAPDNPFDLDEVWSIVEKSEPINMVVLAADIRRSTFLMKEALDLPTFAATISGYVDLTKQKIRRNYGWFDKFTGDGFLAYWLYRDDAGSRRQAVTAVMHTCEDLLKTFSRTMLPNLRENSRNFPFGVGLSLGLDSGPAHLVKIADDLTMVGPPVVGAVRMVSAAKPWETLANVNLGDFLDRNPGAPHVAGIELCYRKTKEYDGQETYRVSFRQFQPPAYCIDDPEDH